MKKNQKIKNEILYLIYTFISDIFMPPSAEKQKERYQNRYGIQNKDVMFFGKGLWTDVCVLRGKSFYNTLLKKN